MATSAWDKAFISNNSLRYAIVHILRLVNIFDVTFVALQLGISSLRQQQCQSQPSIVFPFRGSRHGSLLKLLGWTIPAWWIYMEDDALSAASTWQNPDTERFTSSVGSRPRLSLPALASNKLAFWQTAVDRLPTPTSAISPNKTLPFSHPIRQVHQACETTAIVVRWSHWKGSRQPYVHARNASLESETMSSRSVAITWAGTSADPLHPDLIIRACSVITLVVKEVQTQDGPGLHWNHWITLAAARGAVTSCSDLQTLIICALGGSLDWLLFSVLVATLLKHKAMTGAKTKPLVSAKVSCIESPQLHWGNAPQVALTIALSSDYYWGIPQTSVWKEKIRFDCLISRTRLDAQPLVHSGRAIAGGSSTPSLLAGRTYHPLDRGRCVRHRALRIQFTTPPEKECWSLSHHILARVRTRGDSRSHLAVRTQWSGTFEVISFAARYTGTSSGLVAAFALAIAQPD
ncbi:uncharacterized protein CLUP02_12367 [Colletotrichum lupini]|uniref:Uncharacterized protein n=1 Tax=Colletotrichum lupini TaxID=145971 RepID=A0A9Q8T0R7_9PEZI|nr:uncharacterized protein CLUP02_12367 [Colletotrichum lupini]UQC86865.1 hypothetical protein CLUP02_12367 [Colletotrichum lupini]